VLLDDQLDADARLAIDEEALARLAAWRAHVGPALTIGGVDLSWIWEIELLAEVFLPETRLVHGVRRAFAALEPEAVEAFGFAPDAAAALAQDSGVALELTAEGPPPRYPTPLGNPWRPPLRTVVLGRIIDLGIPGPARGRVYAWPYWHLAPLLERLADDLLLDLRRLPMTLGARRVAAALARGAFAPTPGPRSRARSAAAVRGAVHAAPPMNGDALDVLLDRRARMMLEQRAGGTLAEVETLARAFRRGGTRTALVPFDSPPEARMILAAARQTGVTSVLVQHGGVYPDLAEGDRTSADLAAVWSQESAAEIEPHARGRVVVTGNPAPAIPGRSPNPAHVLVLGESVSRVTARVTARVPLEHTRIALEAVAAALPGAAVVVRPHPVELDPAAFERLARSFPQLDARVVHGGPIDPLIADARLCVGAISTATLQAGAAGVPLAMLNVSGRPAPAPLDGSGPIPLADSGARLVEAIQGALERPADDTQRACTEALGVRAGACEAVLELIRHD
jgi:hypothetical protein